MPNNWLERDLLTAVFRLWLGATILTPLRQAPQSERIEDAMYIMHDDGSVNIIENLGSGVITSEVISSANILKVLQHYRPFKEVFIGNIQ